MKLTINNVEFDLKFSWKFFKALQEHWDLPSVQAIFNGLGERMSGREIDTFVELIYFCGKTSGAVGSESITEELAGEWVFDNLNLLPAIGKELETAISKGGDNEGKQKAVESKNH